MAAIRQLTVKLFIYSLLIGGLVFVIQAFLRPDWIHSTFWIMLSFFMLLTWVTGMLTSYLIQISKDNSVNILLGAIGIRLMASIGFITIMLLLKTENIILFVVNFFTVYLLYLLFDIYGVIANLRPNSR
jgi:hypothetical protein